MSQAKTVATRDENRSWAHGRSARPARLKSTAAKGGGDVLRLDFREPDGVPATICRDEFFEILDEDDLAFLELDETASGDTGRVSQFADR